MLLFIDNYDSFTYNIVQYFAELGQEVVVRRNDDITLEEIEALKPQYLVIGPGPCSPKEAGISVARHAPFRRQAADYGRVPRASDDRRSVRRGCGAGKNADARQSFARVPFEQRHV